MAGGVIGDAIEGFMGAVIKPILDKIVPDAKDRLEASELIQTQLQQLNLQQIEIDKIEAASTNVFVSGWRPCIGWVCAAAFGYSAIVEPCMRWAALVHFKYAGAFPVIDTNVTMQVMLALLGMAGLRTYEKLKDVHSK